MTTQTEPADTIDTEPPRVPGRLCLFCDHLWADMGSPDYSEWTRGTEARMECMRGHWEIGTETGDCHAELVQNMLRGEACPDFAVSHLAPQSVVASFGATTTKGEQHDDAD